MRIQCEDARRPEYELFKAVQDCNLREVRRLLREGANANLLLKRKGGISPFHLSVGLTGHKALEIVAVLLDGNAHPNNRSHDGLTPLHIAAMWGHLQAVELLVNSDADIELCDNEGKTALMLAREMGQYHVARYLDKLQRHIITAVCEAEEACRMDQNRHSTHSQATSRQTSNLLSQSEESDSNSMKNNNNIKLNIQPQHRSKSDAFTQFPDGPRDLDKIRWSSWVRQVTESTPGVRRFNNIQNIQSLNTPDITGYSDPLTACLRGYPMKNVIHKTESISKSFGTSKHYFTYILLDPRYTKNLPIRAAELPLQECFRVFCSSLFHVGCGSKSRPLAHLQEAANRSKDSNKVRRIRSLWSEGYGPVSVMLQPSGLCHEEALTRQALLVSALGLHNVTNVRGGVLHGPYSSWARDQVSELGVVLLFRAMLVYLSDGEKAWQKHELV